MKYLVLLLTVLLYGCAGLSLSMNHHVLKDFQQAINTQHFKEAERIAAHIPKSHPEYAAVQQALPQLHQAEKSFAAEHMQVARQLADTQKIPAALDLLNNAVHTLPTPPSGLLQLQKELQAEHQQQNRLQLSALLTSEADWLLSQNAALDALSQQQQSADAQHLAKQIQARRPDVATRLTQLGQDFAARQDWVNSYHCLQLAKQLGATVPQDTLQKAKDQLQKEQHRREQQASQKQREEAELRINRYQKTQLMVDLLAARQYVRAHNKKGELAEQAAQVDTLSQQRFDHDMHLGDTLYAKGNYQSAARIWRRLAPLYPHNNDLDKKLERVDKVLHSLGNLKQH